MLKRETDLIGHEIYIGATMFQDPKVARLVPLALARPDGWRRVTPSRFPDEGNVVSFDPKVLRRPKGFVVLFTVAPSDRPGGRDRFVTTEVDEPYQLVHELAGVTAEARRTALLKTGLDRNLQEEPRVLVPMGDGEVAFPRLQRGTADRWTLSLQEEAEKIDVYAVPAGGFREFLVDGRAFALPGRVPTRTVGCVNWQADGEFLQYLVRKLRKAGAFTSVADDFRITERMIGRLQAFYRDTDVIGERAGSNEAVRDRLGELLEKLTAGSAALAEIADALHGHPDVRAALARLSQADLDELRDRELARLRPALTSQIEGELAARYAERDALRTEVDGVTSLLADRTEALREVEALAGPGMESLREGLGSYLDRIRDAGSTLGRMMDLAGPALQSKRDPMPWEAPPWTSASGPHASALPLADLSAAAEERAKGLGLPLEILRTMDILCRAGEIPILCGDSVETSLACYAGLVTGGEIARMPLDPTVLGPDDVWRRPASGEPTAFADVWRSALAAPDRFVLLCLDDLDRASLSDWFPRFRSLYRGGRPSNMLVVATVSGDDEPGRSRGDDLKTRVCCNAGRKAYLAALRGRKLPGARKLAPPKRPTLSPDEREALLERLSGLGAGGDLGARLTDVYLAARAWFEHEAACEFAATTIPTDRGPQRSEAECRVISLNATGERKGQSS